MKAEERTISNILTEQICYEVPPYQRPYSWERENVQQLIEDVWESYEANDAEYFIGSLITIEREKDRRYDVVDGQQRLTTLNLIFACLRDRIADDAAKAELGKRILPRNVLTGEAETPRLLLRRKDQSFFRKHVLEGKALAAKDREGLATPQRHLVENLDVVHAFCEGKPQQVLKLFANYLLSKVYVVFVTTQSLQSAYRLFNVLNARGIPLSNADLIKNSLFSHLEGQAGRSEELEERWLELEDELGIERLDAFFSHHRTSLRAAKARGSLHEEIEPLIRTTDGGPFVFLDGVVSSARNYVRIVEGDFADNASLRALRALRRVEYDEWIPPLLAFLNHPVVGLPVPEFIELLEKITIQNWVRRLGRAARLTAYFQLISAIRDGKSADDIRQIFRKNAQNAEFLELLSGTIYGKPFDAAVLLRLDEASQDESVTKTYSGRITIEHVLPQSLKDTYWQSRYSEEQHGLWLHRIGNLALLCGHKNYKAQNYDFARKKKIYSDRNKKVSFDLTKEICDELDWTADKIEARQERLMGLAKQIWTIE
jgi:Protein of unknown function DUF262/Protein of unknown function (DUF1524)